MSIVTLIDRARSPEWNTRGCISWPPTIVAWLAALLMILSAGAGLWPLVVGNALLLWFNLGVTWTRWYKSISRCPSCGHRSPGHREGCRGYMHTASWNA